MSGPTDAEFLAGRRVAEAGGFRWLVRDDEEMDRCLLRDDGWELDVTTAARRILQPGMVAVDVGANFGWFSVLFGRLVGPNGHVHAFEPSPAYGLLRENLRLNDSLGNLSRWNAAAWDANGWGEVSLGFHHPTTGGSGYHVHSVRTVALDDALAGAARLDLLKIDVDGYEPRVLRGAAGLIRKHRPAILLEIGVDTWGPREGIDGERSVRDGFALLAGLGLAPHVPMTGEPRGATAWLDCLRSQGVSTVNVLFLPEAA